MADLAWLTGLAALFVLLHVAVAAYLYRATAATGGESASEYVPARERTDRQVDHGEEHVPCPTCGTPNDPTYRFCRRCVADLQSSVAAGRGGDRGKRLGS